MPGTSHFGNGFGGRKFSTTVTKSATNVPSFSKQNLVIVGSGPGSIRFLKQLGAKGFSGNVMVISRVGNSEWMEHIHKMRPYYPLGQSRETILELPPEQIHGARERMPVGEFLRNQQYEAVQAVDAFNSDQLDCLEGTVTSIKKNGSGVAVQLDGGIIIHTDRVVFATGLGPERDLASTGAMIVNSPTGARVVQDENTTAIKSFIKAKDYYDEKRILVYGGSATSAWVSENAVIKGTRQLTWLSASGFEGADPNGNNSEIMEATEDVRKIGRILSVEYQGDLETGSGLEVTILDSNNKKGVFQVDKIISAIGSNPLQATGIQSILGAQLYNELLPVHTTSGFFAASADFSVAVTISPVSGDSRFQADFKKLMEKLAKDTRIPPSIASVRASADAIVELIPVPPEKKKDTNRSDSVVLTSDQYHFLGEID